MSAPQEKRQLNLLEQGELEVDSDSTLNEDDRPKSPVAKTHAQISQLMELGASRLSILRPQFLSLKKPGKLRRTAYLDGIRGFAALLVYLLHHSLWAHAMSGGTTKLENTFGWDGQYYLGAFPYIRTFFTGGHYAVATFFVLSGYVLSTKPLMQIQAGEYTALGDGMASGLFRRWFRLFIPIWVVTFCYACMPHVVGIAPEFKIQSNLRDEIWHWYCELKNFTFVWNMGGEPFLEYQKHVWSIPVEMRGSITIYTALLAFSRCTRNARLWCEVGLMWYFIWIVDGTHYAMFVAGMFLADLDLLAMDNNLPEFFHKLTPHKTTLAYCGFFLSLTLGGVPSNSADIKHLKETPVWRYFAWMSPQAVFDFRWFFLFWAAVLIVVSVPRIHWLKAFFETRFIQYLGRISYMFYLIHGPILWTIGDRLYAATGWVNFTHAITCPGWAEAFPLPKWGPFGLEVSYIVPQLILFPLTLWAGEILTSALDDPCVKFGQWLYSKTQPPRGSSSRDEQRKA